MIVFHFLRLLYVRSVDVMTFSHRLFFSSIILSADLVPASMVVLPNGLLEYCFLYALERLCYSSDGPGMYCSFHPLGGCFLYVTRIISMNLIKYNVYIR